MAEAPLPDDPGGPVVPVAFKVGHELRADERDPKLADLVERLSDAIVFEDRRVLYSWIGGTRRDWRGQGQFRALTEEQEVWAIGAGFDEVVVKTKNRFFDMRGTLDTLGFEVVKFERHPTTTPARRCTSARSSAPTCSTRTAASGPSSAGSDPAPGGLTEGHRSPQSARSTQAL